MDVLVAVESSQHNDARGVDLGPLRGFNTFMSRSLPATSPVRLLATVWIALAAAVPMTDFAQSADSPWIPRLTVGTNLDGRMVLFELDRGYLRHRWQRESLHDWSSWSILDETLAPGIAVVNDAGGRLGVFGVDQNSGVVKYAFQKAANSPAWSGWEWLLGATVRGPVAAALDAKGRLEVFAVDSAAAGSVKHTWQGGAATNWLPWADMGGELKPGVVVSRNLNGALEVFALDRNDDVLTHCWQTDTNNPEAWSPWTRLDAALMQGFAVAQNRDGRLEVLGVSETDGMVGHICQQNPAPGAAWSAWSSLGARMRPGIAYGRCRDGRIEIFTVSPTNNMIYHTFQMRSGATNWANWTDMSLMGGLSVDRSTTANYSPRWTDPGGLTRAYPAIGRNSDGVLDIFAVDPRSDEVDHRNQTIGPLNWTDWLSLDATTAQYMSKMWRMEDGLPDNRVQALAQTPDGYLWVGTHGGLVKFDGARFVPFDLTTVFGVKALSITCLCAASDGTLWIGSEADGVAALSGGRAVRYMARTGLAGDSARMIFEARDRSIWIGTGAGLSHYQAGKIVNYTETAGLRSRHVRSGLEDSFGAIWIATDNGLNRINDHGVVSYCTTNGLPDNVLTGMWQDVPGRLWIGSEHGLIFYRGGQFHAYDQGSGLSDRMVGVVHSDSQGNIWAGNNDGLNVFKEGRFTEELDQEGHSFGKINALFNDREGNLWAGSQDGLVRLTPKRLLVYGRQRELTHGNITCVTEDTLGSLWVGTWGGGLNQLKDETVTAYNPASEFPLDLISALACSRDGSLWAGGPNGAGWVRLQQGEVVGRSGSNDFSNASIKVLCEDKTGNLWIGLNRGVMCWNGETYLTNDATVRLTEKSVQAICETADGAVWFGAENGLTKWKAGQAVEFSQKDGLSDNHVTALYEDDDRALWVGTQNGGLNCLRKGHWTHYSSADGLFSDEILEIVEDDFGWLWMSCSKGVFRARKADLFDFDQHKADAVASIAYGHDDGMASVLCGAGKPGGWKTRDGEIWFPTGDGLVAFDPRSMKVNRTPPPVYIEELLADKHPIICPREADAPAVRVPPGRGDLEFNYTAPSFRKPERISFRYKLEGIDREWVDAGSRRVAYYNNLAPGKYRFRVMACNSDGVWNTDGAAVSILLAPHLWQTWWFRLLAVSAVTGIVAGTARQVTRNRMQRKMELLEQRHAIEKERLRIAQDIHDDLGGSLTQIALLGELAIGSLTNPGQAARHLAKITDSARLNVRALDEIVWAVHPGNDTLNSLVLYLWQFAEEFFGPTNVRCRVEAPASIPNQPLSADLRHGIFLIVKEAFNNTIKHAAASEVRLRFSLVNSNFCITIEDNGRGFDAPAVNGSGNGLVNMERRMAEFGGAVSVSTAPGKGTRLELVLPLKDLHHVN